MRRKEDCLVDELRIHLALLRIWDSSSISEDVRRRRARKKSQVNTSDNISLALSAKLLRKPTSMQTSDGTNSQAKETESLKDTLNHLRPIEAQITNDDDSNTESDNESQIESSMSDKASSPTASHVKKRKTHHQGTHHSQGPSKKKAKKSQRSVIETIAKSFILKQEFMIQQLEYQKWRAQRDDEFRLNEIKNKKELELRNDRSNAVSEWLKQGQSFDSIEKLLKITFKC
ncbi:hypothetical protein O181_008768 [Austropuccinia psidii MF-1]|uniref:No apical meristem-associated C-terminal domain-containing protein n=1 Tax=Austropuccinia psidii MF-1 TaxID=1389203 RepID=A0A9Q3BPS2_9BASI|nr:hypothetical protein [Austropuccinia psidii MF-1]